MPSHTLPAAATLFLVLSLATPLLASPSEGTARAQGADILFSLKELLLQGHDHLLAIQDGLDHESDPETRKQLSLALEEAREKFVLRRQRFLELADSAASRYPRQSEAIGRTAEEVRSLPVPGDSPSASTGGHGKEEKVASFVLTERGTDELFLNVPRLSRELSLDTLDLSRTAAPEKTPVESRHEPPAATAETSSSPQRREPGQRLPLEALRSKIKDLIRQQEQVADDEQAVAATSPNLPPPAWVAPAATRRPPMRPEPPEERPRHSSGPSPAALRALQQRLRDLQDRMASRPVSRSAAARQGVPHPAARSPRTKQVSAAPLVRPAARAVPRPPVQRTPRIARPLPMRPPRPVDSRALWAEDANLQKRLLQLRGGPRIAQAPRIQHELAHPATAPLAVPDTGLDQPVLPEASEGPSASEQATPNPPPAAQSERERLRRRLRELVSGHRAANREETPNTVAARPGQSEERPETPQSLSEVRRALRAKTSSPTDRPAPIRVPFKPKPPAARATHTRRASSAPPVARPDGIHLDEIDMIIQDMGAPPVADTTGTAQTAVATGPATPTADTTPMRKRRKPTLEKDLYEIVEDVSSSLDQPEVIDEPGDWFFEGEDQKGEQVYNIVRTLTDVLGLNVVVKGIIAGKMIVNMQKRRAWDVLKFVLKQQGLEWELREGNLLILYGSGVLPVVSRTYRFASNINVAEYAQQIQQQIFLQPEIALPSSVSGGPERPAEAGPSLEDLLKGGLPVPGAPGGPGAPPGGGLEEGLPPPPDAGLEDFPPPAPDDELFPPEPDFPEPTGP